MNWTELLHRQIEKTYHATQGLLAQVDESALDWKPATGGNWMTTGQLLAHLPSACGACCRMFVTGVWDMSEGSESEMPAEDEMLPPADKLPSATSVAEVRKALEADKAVALAMVAEAGESDLEGKLVGAPWDPTPRKLGQHFIEMVEHLAQHKGQLFYYLKLQGKPVHTGDLWGIA